MHPPFHALNKHHNLSIKSSTLPSSKNTKTQMEKKSSGSIAHYAMKMAQPCLGFFGILKEAFITSRKNGRILFFITIIVLSCYTAMEIANTFVFLPIAKDFLASAALLPNSSIIDADPVARKAFLTNFRHVLTYGFAYLWFLSLVLVFAIAASVHSSFEAYTGKVMTLKEALLGMKGRWRRALKTSVWMGVISSAIGALLLFGLAMGTIFAEGSALTRTSWGFGIIAGFSAIYLLSLWMVAAVVSVMEDGVSGLKAIGEAGELMQGNKFRGLVLTAVMLLANWGLSLGFGLLERGLPKGENEKLAVAVGLAMGLPQNLVYCALMLFGFVAFTVYYHECKQRKVEMETRAMYAPLAVAQF